MATVQLDKATFEVEADIARAINDSAEEGYAAFVRGPVGVGTSWQALRAILRKLIWIDTKESRRSLLSVPTGEFKPAQIDLLKSLQGAWLAECRSGHWRLIHDSVIDYWKSANEIYLDDRIDRIVAAIVKEEARRWYESGRRNRDLLDEDWWRRPSGLAEPARLPDVERMFGRWGEDLDGSVRKFIEASLLRQAPRGAMTDSDGVSSLYWVACSGNEHIVAHYLPFFEGAINSRRPKGRETAIFGASSNDAPGVIEALIARGADIRSTDDEGMTPLHMAAYRGRLASCRILLGHGADPRARTKVGTRPLDCAVQEGHSDVAKLLIETDAEALDMPGWGDRTALVLAARNGRSAIVRWLLGRGADPRRRAANGARALDSAAGKAASNP
jgi:hypothetical protein